MKNEFIDKNTKYISRTGTVNGVRGNIWTIWKKVDSEWVLAGELFALKAADKSSIISAASYFYPDQRKKFSMIEQFRKIVEYCKTRCSNIAGK